MYLGQGLTVAIDRGVTKSSRHIKETDRYVAEHRFRPGLIGSCVRNRTRTLSRTHDPRVGPPHAPPPDTFADQLTCSVSWACITVPGPGSSDRECWISTQVTSPTGYLVVRILQA